MFSKVLSLENTDESQIYVSVSKRAGTDSSDAAHQDTNAAKIVRCQALTMAGGLRDFETIDSEQRLLAAVWWSIREDCGEQST